MKREYKCRDCGEPMAILYSEKDATLPAWVKCPECGGVMSASTTSTRKQQYKKEARNRKRIGAVLYTLFLVTAAFSFYMLERPMPHGMVVYITILTVIAVLWGAMTILTGEPPDDGV